MACANAAGHVLSPMVIFKGERFNHEWSVGEVPDTLYGMSESGWIDQELFFYWLKKLFIKQIPPQCPVMLLYDGHSLHYTPNAIAEAVDYFLLASKYYTCSSTFGCHLLQTPQDVLVTRLP